MSSISVIIRILYLVRDYIHRYLVGLMTIRPSLVSIAGFQVFLGLATLFILECLHTTFVPWVNRILLRIFIINDVV